MDDGTYRRAVGLPSRSDSLCFGLGEVWRRRHWSLRLRCHVRDTVCHLRRRGSPRRQWRTALAVFIAIIVSAMSALAIWSALQGTLSALNFLDVGMSLAGSAFAFIVLRK